MIKKEFSLYLDLARFVAALLVVVNHSNHRQIVLDPLPQWGHSAVMVFFVLSGFVIAYVATTRERTPKEYAISRFTRIYSVVPVALVVTLLADFIVRSLAPDFYRTVGTDDHTLIRLISSFFFLNEVWSISITTYSNVPYWSLNYEVWYYILFGMVMFLRGRTRIALVAATVLLLGPKIVLLAPIWALGVYLYHSRFFASLHERAGWLLFMASLVGIWAFHEYGIREIAGAWLESVIGPHYYTELAYSKSFFSDYLLAALVFANFAGFRSIGHRFTRVLNPLSRPIRYVAGYTFVLYLTHQPLIWLFKTAIDGDPADPLFLVQVWLCTLASVWLLGQLTERRRSGYRAVAIRVIEAVERVRLRFFGKPAHG